MIEQILCCLLPFKRKLVFIFSESGFTNWAKFPGHPSFGEWLLSLLPTQQLYNWEAFNRMKATCSSNDSSQADRAEALPNVESVTLIQFLKGNQTCHTFIEKICVGGYLLWCLKFLSGDGVCGIGRGQFVRHRQTRK